MGGRSPVPRRPAAMTRRPPCVRRSTLAAARCAGERPAMPRSTPPPRAANAEGCDGGACAAGNADEAAALPSMLGQRTGCSARHAPLVLQDLCRWHNAGPLVTRDCSPLKAGRRGAHLLRLHGLALHYSAAGRSVQDISPASPAPSAPPHLCEALCSPFFTKSKAPQAPQLCNCGATHGLAQACWAGTGLCIAHAEWLCTETTSGLQSYCCVHCAGEHMFSHGRQMHCILNSADDI